MKPTRGLSGSWFGNLSRDRQTTVISLVILMATLAALALYQRFRPPGGQTPPESDQLNQPNVMIGAVPAQPPATRPDPGAAPPTVPPNGPPVAQAVHAWAAPMAESHRVLKTYSALDDTFGDFRYYGGIAYQASTNDPVMAVAAGTVADVVDHHPLDGGLVVIDHGDGLLTRYAGLGKILVGRNARVGAGTTIGLVGDPGPAEVSLGVHLKFQVLRNGQAEDPTTYFAN